MNYKISRLIFSLLFLMSVKTVAMNTNAEELQRTFIDIRALQAAARYSILQPNRARNILRAKHFFIDLDNIVPTHKQKCQEMRELAKEFSDDQLKAISEKADSIANWEAETF